MTKKITITILTAIICAFFANIYMNASARNQCRKAMEICKKEGRALSQYEYKSGYFGHCHCRIECKKDKVQ